MSMIANIVALSPAQLASVVADPDSLASILYPEADAGPGTRLDIDKAWHAIHFTLNASAWGGIGPLSLVILGGQEMGGDIGYGPARVLTPDEVRAVADALASITGDAFSARFSPADMDAADIYPQGWADIGPDALPYVLEHYRRLRAFYQEAAGRGDAAILYLNQRDGGR